MRANQKGEAIEECQLFTFWSEQATEAERDQALRLVLRHLGLEVWRTNATKHGNVELELRSVS